MAAIKLPLVRSIVDKHSRVILTHRLDEIKAEEWKSELEHFPPRRNAWHFLVADEFLLRQRGEGGGRGGRERERETEKKSSDSVLFCPAV